MKKTILITMFGLIFVGGISFAVLWSITPSPTTNRPTTGGTTSLPNTSSGGTSQVTTGGINNVDVPTTGGVQNAVVPVATIEGGTVSVQDFKATPQVATTPDIPGMYILAGGTDPTKTGAPYSIFYLESDQSFTISLFAEPIGEVRKQAEQDLLKQLGIPQNTACGLRYQVLVPYRINSFYSGKNLGFSFCSGATPL